MTRSDRLALGSAILGAILVVIGVLVEPRQALTSYVFAYMVALTMVLGALMHLMIGQVTGARWFDVFRRVALDVAGAMPALVVLALPILVGVRLIYPWAMPALLPPDAQQVVARKHAWLNAPFFVIRGVIYVVVFVVFAEWFRRWSLRAPATDVADDAARAHHLRKVSAGGLIATGVALTFASFDWLMSLEPTWYSTIYGVYIFASGILAALALVGVITAQRAGGAPSLLEAATVDQRAAYGTLLFTYVIFWAYIGFAQYLIIWIGDVPSDVSWYVVRTHGSWGVLAAVIAIGQFAVPFLLLLPYRLKRRPGLLVGVAAWIVAMHVLDLYWVVLPSLRPLGAMPSWLDIGALLFVGGVVTTAATWRTRRAA